MKVLVVDDEPSLCEFLAESVRLRGFPVLTAGDGLEGIRAFEAEKPDLVFTDIRMPHMDGLDLLSAIRERDRETIVVVITSLGSEEFALEALRRGANDFLRKPIHHQILFPLLEKYTSMIAARTRMQGTRGLFLWRRFAIQFDNSLEQVPDIVQRLLLEVNEAVDPEQRLGTRIGLVELIANAIEHGNLEISFEEKTDAMNRGLDGIQLLYEARRKRPHLANRRVTVECSFGSDGCEWIITDEGPGFDWQAIPNPTDPANLAQPNGRGIFLARMQFDEVEFLGRGNQVRVRKKRVPFTGGHS